LSISGKDRPISAIRQGEHQYSTLGHADCGQFGAQFPAENHSHADLCGRKVQLRAEALCRAPAGARQAHHHREHSSDAIHQFLTPNNPYRQMSSSLQPNVVN
jgi:hypothetical protein